MKRKILPFMGLMLTLAACQSASKDIVLEVPKNPADCDGGHCQVIRYASPNSNDLVLETSRHIIQIDAETDTPYSYYIWTGDKNTSEEPDLILEYRNPNETDKK